MTDVSVEDERGREIPVVNPLALPHDRFPSERLFKMWAGQTGTTFGYVWSDSEEDAFEEWVEYLDEHAPGHLVSHEEFVELLDEAAREKGFQSWADAEAQWLAKNGKHAGWHNDMMNDYSEIVESAEADLTIIGHTSPKHGGYIASYEWGFDEIDRSSEEFDSVWQACAEAYEAQYDELPEPPKGVTPPKSQKRMKMKLDGISTQRRPKWTVPPRRK